MGNFGYLWKRPKLLYFKATHYFSDAKNDQFLTFLKNFGHFSSHRFLAVKPFGPNTSKQPKSILLRFKSLANFFLATTSSHTAVIPCYTALVLQVLQLFTNYVNRLQIVKNRFSCSQTVELQQIMDLVVPMLQNFFCCTWQNFSYI